MDQITIARNNPKKGDQSQQVALLSLNYPRGTVVYELKLKHSEKIKLISSTYSHLQHCVCTKAILQKQCQKLAGDLS